MSSVSSWLPWMKSVVDFLPPMLVTCAGGCVDVSEPKVGRRDAAQIPQLKHLHHSQDITTSLNAASGVHGSSALGRRGSMTRRSSVPWQRYSTASAICDAHSQEVSCAGIAAESCLEAPPRQVAAGGCIHQPAFCTRAPRTSDSRKALLPHANRVALLVVGDRLGPGLCVGDWLHRHRFSAHRCAARRQFTLGGGSPTPWDRPDVPSPHDPPVTASTRDDSAASSSDI